MAPLSLKIVQGGGAITRTVLFDTTMRVSEAHEIVKEKVLLEDPGKDYGLFLTSADDELSGVWLEGHRTLDYYMLRDGDSLHYLCRTRNLRVRMLDGSEKTMQVDESKCVGDLMKLICDRIGITNHEEYGLCFENMTEELQEEKPVTGTLTLKRVNRDKRERDAKLEQLSKKLKTDDNVEWLEQHKTLREIGVDLKETVLLKRRLFYSDRNVDSHDPVQLNLLYVQTRDAILDGRQAITEEKAIEFAGIQCQVQYGDFQEDKHKAGFIENLKEFLPEQYASSWGVEKKVFKEHSKHRGLSPLEAKHLYTKNARELPTYGVTFFLVKEQQKGKKKLVPRLLGINAESILRLDEVTKDILQVWNLTQVKTFRAGKETFTLDFGDYSDKEYTVKTNEAHRIRDILQGYIDIIHRSIAGPFNVIADEGMTICEENIQSSKGQIIQNVVPEKVVEHSYVGPSRLVPFVQGSVPTHGTQIMTAHQVLVTKKGAVQQRGIPGATGIRSGGSMEYLKKLNRLNTNSVETVEFLTDPSNNRKDKIQKVNALATIVEEDMNSIVEGVHKTVEKDNEETRKKLLTELDELCASLKLLTSTTKQNNFGNPESLSVAQQAAERMAGLCTNIYCSLDPGVRRRSKILKRSHKSFIADEKTESKLRRASFLAASSHACKTVDRAKEELYTTFDGAIPIGQEVDKLEREARKKIGKLTAAVALLIAAQADPNNPDYSAAISSITTIDELLPELIQDAKALGSVKDKKSQQILVNKMKALCDAARSICSLSGDENKEQIQELAYKYAKASDKLVFTFGRGTVADKENEILDLARDIGQKTSLLLMKTHELINLAESDPRAAELDQAGVQCADASKLLLACSQLTASSIHEPHCQSAMAAMAETLSSSAQHLAVTWKPIVDAPGHRMFEESLLAHTMDLMRALDRLKEAYSELSAEESKHDNDPTVDLKERLKFVASKTINNLSDAHKDLDKPYIGKVEGVNVKKVQRSVGQELSILNASVASLIRATADRECPDCGTAEEAFAIISEIMPKLVEDLKIIIATKNEKAGRALLNELRGLCQATRDICSVMDLESINDGNDTSSKYIRHSNNLCNEFIRPYPREKDLIIDLSRETSEKASQLLEPVNQLVDKVGEEDGQKLDSCGSKLVDVVQVLLTTAQITAPSFIDARCQSTMLAATDDVYSMSRKLAATWSPLIRDPDNRTLQGNLDVGLAELEKALNNLRILCMGFDTVKKDTLPDANVKAKERIKFVTTLSSLNNQMSNAEKELQEQAHSKADITESEALQRNLKQRLAQLNGAIASLVRATKDPDSVDYDTVEQSINTISQMIPDIINETKALATSKDDSSQREMLAELRKLFDATREVCKHTEKGNTKALNDSALKFADASKKLTYVFNPRSVARKENQITDLSKAACAKASTMLANVHQLAESVGEEDGIRLDNCGVNIVNSAKSLLTTAQILDESLSDPSCKSTLLSAIDDVTASTQKLSIAWSPIKQDKKYEKELGYLEEGRCQLDLALKSLRAACEEINDTANKDALSDTNVKAKERIKFVTTLSSLNNQMLNVEKDLQEKAPRKADVTEAASLQRNLGQRFAQLNVALASLVRATKDPDDVDYDTMEQSLNTISRMIPDILMETKSLSTLKDDKGQQEMLAALKKLFDATRDVCKQTEQGNPNALNESVLKFTDASKNLTYVFNPRRDARKENRITDLSKNACAKASTLLTNVHQLAESVGGEDGIRLDNCGVKVVNSAKNLLTTAQLLDGSLSDPSCKATLLSATDDVTASTQQLSSAWSPIIQDKKYEKEIGNLEDELRQLKLALNSMRAACVEINDTAEKDALPVTNEKQRERIKFVKTLSSLKNQMSKAENELKEQAHRKPDATEAAVSQRNLRQRLAQLGGAIASLVRATTDPDNVDYNAVEQCINTISHMLPVIVNESKSLSTLKDDRAQRETLVELTKLFDAIRDLCNHTEEGDTKALNESALKFADASKKITYVFSPRSEARKENQIIDLSKNACAKASTLLTNVHQLAESVGGEDGICLDNCGVKLVNSAQTLLTASQILDGSLSDPSCKATLLSALEDVTASTQQLSTAWIPINRDKKYEKEIANLEEERCQLDFALNSLRAACEEINATKVNVIPASELKRFSFIESLSVAKNNIMDAEKELDKPATAPVGVTSTGLQRMLAQQLAHLNAAIASLIRATSNETSLDYAAADKASRAVAELIPDIINNSNSLLTSKDDQTRRNLIAALKDLCEASKDICLESELGHAVNAYEPISKFVDASSKLCYVFNPQADLNRENLIVELSKFVCDKASVLLSQVYQLAESIGGEEGAELDIRGAKVVDAAQLLLTNAQITGPSIADPQCQSTLLNSADEVSSLSRGLANNWSFLLEDPKRKDLKELFVENLSHERSELERAIEELKEACKDAADVTLKPSKHHVPKIVSVKNAEQNINQEEKAKLMKNVAEVINTIAQTEDQIREMYNEAGDIPSPESTQVAVEQLQRKLAIANVAASHLVFCNEPEKINYKVASKSVKTLSELFPTIVKDVREVCNPRNVQAKAILDDTLGLCEATRHLCGIVKDDREKLNEAAVDFANKSTKLLYAIGTGVDPEQEKEVLSRVKVIGDCASRLACCGAAAAQSGDAARAQALCDAGGSCANAASHLLYICKLVAPAIQYPESQNILLTAADQLMSHVKQFSSVCSPLSSEPERLSCMNDLEEEGNNLEKLLNDFIQDVESNNMVKRRKENVLIAEDSPMRQLALEILDSYKNSVESPHLSMEERGEYARNADKLSAAIKELDIASAHCRNTPQDINALRALENSTLNLQQTLLQCRVGPEKEQSNIVDLMDYVTDVVNNIETLSRSVEEINTEDGRKQFQTIKEECQKMSKHAVKATTPSDPYEGEDLTDSMVVIDAFAKDCQKRVSNIKSLARDIDDAQSRKELEIKAQSLTDSINMLRFGVKSALATAGSAALDESLHDLVELENRLDTILQPIEGMQSIPVNKDDSVVGLCCASASAHSSASQLTPALAKYITEARMGTDLSNPQEVHRLKGHVQKLLHMVKTLMITTSRRMATWQEQDEGETMTITDQIIQELEEFDSAGSDKESQQNKVIDKVDIRRLLLPPSGVRLDDGRSEITKKFNQTASKLNCMLGTIVNSVQQPQRLSRSHNTTADLAIELGSLARSLKNEDLIHNNRIEESTRDLSFATFQLLKNAEQASYESDSPVRRRRVLDACRALNDCINKLSRVTKSKQDGDELLRNLQLQQSVLQTLQPTCALNYTECVEALQNQSDVIYKLKSDEGMSHEESTATLQYISSTICSTAEYALQCAYLISISDKKKEAARVGLLDVDKMYKLTQAIQDNCVRIVCLGNINQIKDFVSDLKDQERVLQHLIKESKEKIEDSRIENEIINISKEISTAMNEFCKSVNEPNIDATKITSCIFKILNAIGSLNEVIKRPTLIPKVTEVSHENHSHSDDVINKSRKLLSETVSLVNKIKDSKTGVTTWVTYDGSRKAVLQAFDVLMNSIKENGHRAGLLESSQTEDEEQEFKKQSHIENQVDLAKKWLQNPSPKEEVKSKGIDGVNELMRIAKEVANDLNGSEKDEMQQVVDDVEDLSKECSRSHNKEKSSLLLERLLELRKMLERMVVTRVVEDFLEDDTSLGDIELLVDVEKDDAKRKYLLEQKIAELLAQMNRVTRTARLVADAGSGPARAEIKQCSQQVELLAPSLVKATQERFNSPHHQTVIDNYKALIAQYTESMSKVRILCDRSVDPVDFVQAAGETMHRVREESNVEDDPLKSAHASNVITRLGWRVVEAGLGSTHVRRDPELRRALAQAQRRLQAVGPRASRCGDWRHVTAEILRTTSEVESALCGETIFLKELDPNQPIFAAALDLHAAVREWSARDNDIVAAAKRMAVLMARLSDYMNQDKKRDVILTSKAIVKAASEVTVLARKLALECTDVRIRNNLLQLCDRIPTISGQLKMLTTVKGSGLGRGNHEDKEAINMLVGNAQNLMQSIQEVVNAAAGASVKIMSQRAGPRIRWVRKNYYNY